MSNLQVAGSRSIAGAVLVGLGTFIQYENLTGAISGLKDLLAANGSEPLGLPLAFIAAASQALQSAHHHWFLQGFLSHLWIASWPLLLVVFGKLLASDAAGQSKA
jgi:hypothetical protein